MTFGTEKNLHTAYKQFEISDFEMAYNAFLRRLTMTKFMVTHHYAYLVLKMLGPNRVITIRQDVKRAYNYERESCKIAEALLASVELQDPKKVMAEYPPPGLGHAQVKDFEDVHPVEGQAQQDHPVVPESPHQGCSYGKQLGS
jgi:hypothetical protein